MEYLGGINLFTSHFIIGCKEVSREFTKTETIEIEALHKWLYIKDNDWGMKKYRTDRTQYIDFLEIIELETFKEITEGLYQSYCKEFPYSTKKDFIKHVFDYTIFDLERFLKLDLHWLGEAPNENNYSFYTVYSNDDREFLDFAINSKFEIAHYEQYYKAVLEYLNSFESDIKEQPETSNKFQRIESDLDKMIWAYEAYVINCRYNFDNVERIRKRSSEMYDREIFNIAHRAVQELKSMVLTGNPQFENTANYYFTKCRKILDEHNKNIKENNLNHVQVMPKIRDYFDTMQPLYNFHDEVLLLLPKLKDQLGQNEALPPKQSKKSRPELTINQIALKYVYSGRQITRENGNETAKKYGHNSGEKLFQRFTHYSSSTNRKAKPDLCTPKKLNNKIKLIESVIELLPTDKQARAKDEVSILKKIYEAEYQ